MQTVVIIAIVAMAAAFIGRYAYRSFRASRKASVGCANCDMSGDQSSDWAK